MYQLLYYSWKGYYPVQNQIIANKNSVYYNALDRNKTKLDMSSNSNAVNVIINNELIKTIDNGIEYTEKQIISMFSCI